VAEAVVIGIPCERFGERVHAIVRLGQGREVDAEALLAHCRSLIAGYKVPRSLEFRTAPFPLSPANKILKRELRKPFWEGRESRIV
jgi:long-chain acyl-CoA synthetase